MRKLAWRLRELVFDESGAALVEYGMLLVLILLVCVVLVHALGAKVKNGFSSANSMLP